MDNLVRRLRSGALVMAALAAIACFGARAETPPAKATPAEAEDKPTAKAEKKTHDVYLEHADRLRRDEKTGDVVVVGRPVVLKHEEGTFTANEITFNEKTKLGQAKGTPTFKDPESNVTADTLEFDFDQRLAVFTGDVTLVVRRKKSESATAEKDEEQETESIETYAGEPTTITCDRLEYYYREKRAVAAGQVKAVQPKGTAEADRATFLVNDELLVVAGNVRMQTDKGETFQCEKITISLKEDDYWLEAEGQVASHFKVSEKEEEKPAPKAPAK